MWEPMRFCSRRRRMHGCLLRKSGTSRGRPRACPTSGNHKGCPYLYDWQCKGVTVMLQTSWYGVTNDESGYNPVGVHRCFPRNGCGLTTNLLARKLMNGNEPSREAV